MERRIRLFSASLSKSPRGAFPEYYRLSLARAHVARIGRLLDAGDVKGAFDASEAARQMLDQVLGADTEPLLKRQALEFKRRNIATLDEIVRQRQDLLGNSAEPEVPKQRP